MKNTIKKIMLIAFTTMLTYNVRAEENDMFVFLESCFSTWPSNNAKRTRFKKYVIGRWSKAGMGAALNSVLCHLSHCRSQDLIPVVYWHGGAYHNPDGFNGENQNEWKYYFNQTSHLTYAQGDIINHLCNYKEYNNFKQANNFQKKRDIAYSLINDYIHLNPIVQAKVDHFYNTHLAGKKTIAIHLRGTDKYLETPLISPERIIAEALKHADKNTQFFLATDEQKLLDAMIALLKGRTVVYYDCYRSENGKPLHVQDNASPTSRIQPSFAQLGEDVIVEMWLMGKCDMFIRTLSNVSAIPLFLNPRLPHVTLS